MRGQPLPHRMQLSAFKNAGKRTTKRGKPAVGVLSKPTRTMYLSEDQYGDLSKMHPEAEFLTMFDGADVVRDGPEVRSFSELTLEWIVSSTKSHMKTHGDSYGFHQEDIVLLSDEPQNTMVSSSSQHTSQWLINRMLSCHHFVHSFTESTDFQPLKNLFKIPNEVEPSMSSDGIMTLMDGDDLSDICIEQTALADLGADWMQTRGYNEGFDVIFDECALDNIIEDEYVQTTIYGHCLKTGGLVYVSDKRMTGDTGGRKLRSKMKALYPKSHFRLIAERDTAWFTQFVFLKASNCSENNPDASSTKSE